MGYEARRSRKITNKYQLKIQFLSNPWLIYNLKQAKYIKIDE